MVVNLQIKEIVKRVRCTRIDLRSTKSNIIEIDGERVKATGFDLWDSGNMTLWCAYPKGKSWSQNSYPWEPSQATHNNEILTLTFEH